MLTLPTSNNIWLVGSEILSMSFYALQPKLSGQQQTLQSGLHFDHSVCAVSDLGK